MKIFLLQIHLLLFCCNVYSQDEINFIQQRTYAKILMSIDDLNKIIEDINYYIPIDTSSSGKEMAYSHSQTLTLSDKSRNLTYKKFGAISKEAIGKIRFNKLRLDYRGINKDISIIEIKLNHYERTLYISGSDQRKIEALFQNIDKRLEICTTTFGWIDWYSFIPPILILLFILIISSWFASFSLPNKDRSWVILIIVGFVVLVFLAYSIVYVMSGEHTLFPKFTLKSEITSWIDRNANNMEFVGFLALVISLFSWLIKLSIKNKTPLDQNSEKETLDTTK